MGTSFADFSELRRICVFFSVYFPLILLLTLLLVTIIMALLEKRRRKLKLIESEAELRINELLQDNVIDEAEAAKLKQAANALPEVKEEYPLPDIHLRLTSALAKTYSLLKILLLISSCVVICMIYRVGHNAPSSANIKYSFKAENLPLLLIFIGLFFILSIVQFVASIKLTRGGIISRRIISFIWLFDLAFLASAMINSNRFVYSAVAILACLYTLWVLYFRRGAGERIAFGAGDAPPKLKALLSVMLMLSLVSGIFFVKSQYNVQYSCSSTATNSRSSFSSSRGNYFSNIRCIAIIPSKNETDTVTMAKGFYESLKKQLPEFEFKYIDYGNTPSDGKLKYDLFAFVSKAEVIKPPRKEFPPMPKGVLQDLEKSMRIPLNASGMPMSDNSISLDIYVKGRFDTSFCYSHKGSLRLPMVGEISGSIIVSSDMSGCSKEAAIEKCIGQAVQKFTEQLRKEADFISLDLPDYLLAEFKEQSFDRINFLKNAWRIGSFRNTEFENFTVFMFPLEKDLKKQRSAIIMELEREGWKRDKEIRYDGSMKFSKGDKNYSSEPFITVIMPKVIDESKNNIIYEPEAKREFGLLACAYPNLRKYSNLDAKKLEKDNFYSFLQCALFYRLKKAEALEIFDRVEKDPMIPFEALDNLYGGTDVKKWKNDFAEKREKILVRMGRYLAKNRDGSMFTRRLITLFQRIDKDKKYKFIEHPALTPIKDILVNATLVEDKENSGIYKSKDIKISNASIPSVLMINDTVKNDIRGVFIIKVEKFSNNENEVSATTLIFPSGKNSGGMNMGSSSRQQGDLKGAYFSLSGNSSNSGTLFMDEKFKVSPGRTGVKYDYLAKEDQFIINIIHNGNVQKKK